MKSTFTLFLLSILLFFSCDDAFDCTPGVGPVITKHIAVADFNGLELLGSEKLYIRQGPVQSVKVSGQENIIDLIETTVRDGVWKIQIRECIRRHDQLVFDVTVPDISMLAVKGSGKIIGEGPLQTEALRLSISGSGEIKAHIVVTSIESEISGSGDILLQGECVENTLKISGSGNFKAYDLQSAVSRIKIQGSGDANVSVSDYLNVTISGSGNVRYLGSPTIESSVNGSGRVMPKK